MCVSHIILNNVKNNRFTWRKHYNEFLCGGIPSEMLSIVYIFFFFGNYCGLWCCPSKNSLICQDTLHVLKSNIHTYTVDYLKSA